MKFLLFLFAICQLAVALHVAPVVTVSSAENSYPPKDTLETAIQNLNNFTMGITSKIWKLPQCGDGIWYQLVSIKMSTTDHSQCPDGWVEENVGVRACGRGTVGPSCQSTFLNVIDYQMECTKICGRAIGYQYYRSTDAFHRINGQTLDQNYVDGLNITYGSPRQHLWTYAAGVREGPDTPSGHSIYNCPCSSIPGASAPSYVGNSWYCESGNPNSAIPSNIADDDPLWDDENCEGTCCSNGKSPPWFSMELSGPTSAWA